MKKLFIFAAACAALVGCAKNESPAPNVNDSSDAKISFTTPLIAPATRALYGNGATYSTSDKFVVNAQWSEGNYSTWTNSTTYMDAVEVAKNSTENYWDAASGSGDKDYYWPKVGVLTFQAYSPSGVNGATFDADGIKFTDYTVDNTSFVDLMFSERVYNKNSSTGAEGGYDGVDIVFKHALSSLKFKAAREEAYTGTEIKITEIKLQNVNTKGTFVQGLDDNGTDTETTVYYWDSPSELAAESHDVVETDHTIAEADVATSPKDITTTDLIALPQEFGTNTALYVKYTINGIEQEYTQLLNALTYTGLENTGKKGFEVGKQYTFTITIGLDKIYFAPAVANWDAVTVASNN